MTNRPPREGARWGEDPKPVVAAPEAAVYEEMYNEYGKDNVDLAVVVFNNIRNKYPHLKDIKRGEKEFTKLVLERAIYSMDKATKERRAHTMPETLAIIDNILGQFLAKNVDRLTLENFYVTYGDEPSKFKIWIRENWIYFIAAPAVFLASKYFNW